MVQPRIPFTKIPGRVSDARARYPVLDPERTGGLWRVPVNDQGTTSVWLTREAAQKDAEKKTAMHVLDSVFGSEDWRVYDWAPFAHDAELMVTQVIGQDLEYREARSEPNTFNVIANSMRGGR